MDPTTDGNKEGELEDEQQFMRRLSERALFMYRMLPSDEHRRIFRMMWHRTTPSVTQRIGPRRPPPQDYYRNSNFYSRYGGPLRACILSARISCRLETNPTMFHRGFAGMTTMGSSPSPLMRDT